MPRTRAALATAALVTASAALATACSPSASSSASSTAVSSAGRTTSSAGGPDATQQYLDSVDALCDALLPKVVAATHGGQLETTAAAYLHDLPAHQRALDEFDADLAKVVVPPAAADAARALTAYIAFADRLDATRLAAAERGQAAWSKELAAESDVEDDPAIRARNAAGIAPSCDAR